MTENVRPIPEGQGLPIMPALAGRIAGMLDAVGIAARIDAQRGFDHGLFIPLKMMCSEANLPCLQLARLRGLNEENLLELAFAVRLP